MHSRRSIAGLAGFLIQVPAAVLVQAVPTDGTAASCPSVPGPLYPFNLAPGWTATKVAGGLTAPRDLVIDPAGRLLIHQFSSGISQHVTDPLTGCVVSTSKLVSDPELVLGHGIALSPDGKTLYASSPTTVWSWPYDPVTGQLTGNKTVLVGGMLSQGHISRTVIVPPHRPDLLVVSYGSDGNLDEASIDPAVGRAIVKVFDISKVPEGGYIYARDGWNAGYGLRNEVALAFDSSMMLWGVENSADNIHRTINDTATDVHVDNPAEELNYLGDVTIPNNNWYGYPTCFTVWDPTDITDAAFSVGDQFALSPNATFTDADCAARSRGPRLSFPAHTAPLGAVFDKGSKNLYVALHGSWNRPTPQGYKVVVVPFTSTSSSTEGKKAYEPVAAADSPKGYEDVFFPLDEGACSASTCVRPVGLRFGKGGRLYMTADASGEVFMLEKKG